MKKRFLTKNLYKDYSHKEGKILGNHRLQKRLGNVHFENGK